VLLSVLRFRVLGPGHVPLPTPRREFWQACQRVERSHRVATGVLDTPFDKALDLYELPGRSAPIRYFGPAHEIVEFFELEQYAYEHGGVRIAASPGDTVVDGGGGWAETALYFADAVGAEGRVFCFEFVPENLVILERNLAENPELGKRIELIPKPLWSTSRQRLSYDPAGPVTSVGGSSGERAATSETIDRLRASRGLARIDFIKLDVEGAELEVLRGAEETLHSCRPRLAVAVYHRIEDLVEIPRFLSALGYELFLDHVAAGPYETVLFARPL
jgi:FkbM family methyltransferase